MKFRQNWKVMEVLPKSREINIWQNFFMWETIRVVKWQVSQFPFISVQMCIIQGSIEPSGHFYKCTLTAHCTHDFVTVMTSSNGLAFKHLNFKHKKSWTKHYDCSAFNINFTLVLYTKATCEKMNVFFFNFVGNPWTNGHNNI